MIVPNSSVKNLYSCFPKLGKIAFAALYTLFAVVAFAEGNPTRQSTIKRVVQEIGPEVQPSELPETFRALNTVFNALAIQQSNRADALGFYSGSELHILNSEQINAFVSVVKMTGKSRAQNIAFLTTGLLRSYIDPTTPVEEIPNRISELAGILAHELGHPADKLEDGIENNWGRPGSQAIELKADSEAVDLLRGAGLPTDSLYRALERMFAKYKPRNVVMSAVTTHPDERFRLSFNRARLTTDRIQNGSNDVVLNLDQFDTKTIETEISKTRKSGQTIYKIELPTTISEFVELYTQKVGLFGNPDSQAWINALYLWLDQYLENNQLSDTDAKRLEKLRTEFPKGKRMSKNLNFSICQTRDCLDEVFKNTTGTDGLNRVPHFEKMRSLPFFDSIDIAALEISQKNPMEGQRYPNWSESEYLKMFLLLKSNEMLRWYNPKALKTWLATLDLPNKIVFFQTAFDDTVGSHAGSQFGEVSKSGQRPSFHREASARNSDASFNFLEWAEYFHSTIVPEMSRSLSEIDPSRPLFRYLTLSRQSISMWRNLVDRTKSPEERTRALAVLNEIWKNRGLWAYLEFYATADFKIEWMEIANELGIDKSTVKASIQREFKKFIYSDNIVSNEDPSFKTIAASGVEDFIELENGKARPIWLSDFFEGTLIDSLNQVKSEKARTALKRVWLSNFYVYYKPAFKKKLVKSISIALDRFSAESEISDDLIAAVKSAEQNASGLQKVPLTFFRDLYSARFEGIRNSKLQELLKVKLIGHIFLQSQNSALADPDDFRDIPKSTWEEVYPYLKSSGLIKNYSDFSDLIYARNETLKNAKSDKAEAIYESVSDLLLAEVDLELNRLKSNKPELLKYIDSLNSSLKKNFKQGQYPNSDQLTGKIVTAISELDFSLKEKLQIFKALVEIATSPETDKYFEQNILPEIEKEKAGKTVRTILELRGIWSRDLEVKLTKLAIEHHFSENVDLFALNEDIAELSPNSSNPKDQLYEGVGWRLNLTGKSLKAFVDDEKFKNWRAQDPRVVALISSYSAYLEGLNKSMKLKLVRYLIAGGQGVNFPDEILQSAKTDLLKISPTSDPRLLRNLDLKLREFKSGIEALVKESTPIQRVPMLDLIMSSGNPALISNGSIYEYLLANYMGVDAQSMDSQMIRAYLDVIPNHERSVTLSYMLLNSREASGKEKNIKAILEMFGTVGIKFGQMAAIWQIFGPEYQKQLEDLFDKADPMSKYEIEQEVKRLVPGHALDSLKIEYVKILGSASVKTVVLAKLANGKKVALMLKRPNADNQIKSNLELAKKFLDRLSVYSIQSSNPLFRPLVQAMEEQIYNEIDFQNEIQNYNKVNEMISSIGKSRSSELGGWTVKAPAIVSDIPQSSKIYGVEAVDGISAKDYFSSAAIGQADKDLVGKIILQYSLEMLFKHGYFDPDRHPGNWLINPKTKEVFFIDPGQLTNFSATKTPWKWDPRLTLSFFLKAIDEKDARALVHYAALMTKTGEINPSVSELARRKIEEIFKGESSGESEVLQKTIEELYRSGIEFNYVYTFGALKGLMVLRGSSYVSPEVFRETLRGEIKSLVVAKVPAVAVNKAKEIVKSQLNIFSAKRPEPKVLRCPEIFDSL